MAQRVRVRELSNDEGRRRLRISVVYSWPSTHSRKWSTSPSHVPRNTTPESASRAVYTALETPPATSPAPQNVRDLRTLFERSAAPVLGIVDRLGRGV